MSNIFKGVTELYNNGVSNQTSYNIVGWINWGLLNIGGFTNIELDNSGVYGGDKSRLRPVSDPNYRDGQIYEGFRSNWVFESGLPYGYQPINISGVYISGVFHTSSSISAAYYINYPLGRVVFTNPINNKNTVRLEYSYRDVNVSTSDCLWFREYQANSLRLDTPFFLQPNSGSWVSPAQNRVQLPAIVVDASSRINNPIGIGLGGGTYREQDILCYIFAETPSERNNLTDILVNQKEQRLFMYDVDKALSSGVLPLDYRGAINSQGLPYSQLIAEGIGYRNRDLVIQNTNGIETDSIKYIYSSMIRLNLKITMPEV